MKTIELNAVTCGNCGKAFGHIPHVEELTCPYCKWNSDVCDFPDYFYPPEHNDSHITISAMNHCLLCGNNIPSHVRNCSEAGYDDCSDFIYCLNENHCRLLHGTCKGSCQFLPTQEELRDADMI